MARFIERKWLNQGDIVVVKCAQHCNVRITDDQNFEGFKKGGHHKYYGGFYRITPARLVVPHTGNWNIVLDVTGNDGLPQPEIEFRQVAR